MKNGIAEVPIQRVPIVNILNDTWQNHQMRAISQGIQTYGVLTGSAVTAAFFQHFRSRLGASKTINLQEAAFLSYKKRFPTATYQPSITEAVTSLADDFIDHMKLTKDNHEEELNTKIKNLEKQIDSHKAKLQTPTTAPSSPTTKRKSDIPLSPSTTKKAKIFMPPPLQDTFTPNTTRPLENSAPPDKGSREVHKWLESIKSSMDTEAAKHMDQYIQDVLKAYKDLSPSKRPSPKDLAARWGLPVPDAAQYSDQLCLKLSSIAAYQTACQTA